MRWPRGARAALSLSFDDARASQPARGFAALEAHGLAATFYVTVQSMMPHLDAWKRAVDCGHEIGNHTTTHPCSGNYIWARPNALEDYTLDRIADDIDAASEQIHQLLRVRPTTFAYPCGQKFVGRGADARSYVPVVAKRFKVGRGFKDTVPNAPEFFDPAQTLGVDLDMQSFDDLLPVFEMTVAQSAWLVLAGHEFGDQRAIHTTLISTIDAIARYCREQNIWIDTVDAVASHILSVRGNPC